MKIILLIATTATLLTGCGTPMHETYKRSALTPSSFDYTLSVDHETLRPSEHYFGFSWDLK